MTSHHRWHALAGDGGAAVDAPPVIAVDGLVKAYGAVRAVDGVSLTVGEGEFFGILKKGWVIVTTSQSYPPPDATQVPARSSRVQWWRLPFSADTWRRTLYVLLALPVGLVSVPLALLGRYRAVARLQRGLARRYLALDIEEPAHHERPDRVLAHAVLSLPLNLVLLALTVYLWLLVPANLAYPLRPGTMDSYQHSWGGPSLAGAWAVHAAVGVVFIFVTPRIVKAITWLQGRLARRLLGAGR